MNIDLLVPLLVTTAVAIVGWLVAHRFAANRDRANKQRDVRISYLIQAYRDLGLAASRKPGSVHFEKLESAFHDIQLFGTPSQLELLHTAQKRWKSTDGADVHLLLADLRDDLRRELNLPRTDMPFVFFRAQE